MAPSAHGYAATAHMATQARAMSPQQVLLALYDFAIAGCVARDARKASAALDRDQAAPSWQLAEVGAH